MASKNSKQFDPRTYVKKSGCQTKMAVTKHGEQKQVTYGWRAVKGMGIIKYFAAPCKHTKKAKSNSGKVWYMGVAVTVTVQNTGQKNFYFGAMDSTGKVIIKDLGIVMNPKGGKGGVVAVIGKK